uniref:Uncharacterized protein n=1 Tax=Setaria italica TaxID=4555 RepID=K4A3L9_SETIT
MMLQFVFQNLIRNDIALPRQDDASIRFPPQHATSMSKVTWAHLWTNIA